MGVRSLVAGDARARLDVPTADVPAAVAALGGRANVSPMVDPWAVLRGEVWESDAEPAGLTLHATTADAALVKWRPALATHARQYTGSAAVAVLRAYLSPDSYADLRELLDLYPGHVVEFTACSREVGKIPGRNAVVWEVRCGDGRYEKW